MEHILSWLIWLPIIGMVVIVLIPRSQEDIIKKVAAVFTGVQFLFSIEWYSNPYGEPSIPLSLP